MNILHLSDMHFGRDQYDIDEPFSKKKEILDKLILKLTELDPHFKPDLVLVTGDIAWHGLKRKFDEAYDWFAKLKSALGFSGDCFVFCPGNHDLNRNVAVDFTEDDLLKPQEKHMLPLASLIYLTGFPHLPQFRWISI